MTVEEKNDDDDGIVGGCQNALFVSSTFSGLKGKWAIVKSERKPQALASTTTCVHD